MSPQPPIPHRQPGQPERPGLSLRSAHRTDLRCRTRGPEHSNSGGNPAMLLDALMRRAVTATFFVQGQWASSYPALVRRMAEAGHDVASHSHHHAPMILLTDEGVRRDVSWAEHRIKKAAGTANRPLFSLPVWGR